MSFMGVFALGDDAVWLRTIYLVLACLIGALLDTAAYVLALRVEWASKHSWRRIGVASLLVTVPIGLLLWGSARLFGRQFSPALLPLFFFNTLVVSGAFIAAFVAPVIDGAIATARQRAEADALAREQALSNAKPANFMERLPRHLRGSELWALKADDHYLQVHTSGGEALIRMRLADALRELTGTEGAQTHRSWWVARSAIHGVRRGAGRLALLLPDGKEVAVSRAFARGLREAGWL